MQSISTRSVNADHLDKVAMQEWDRKCTGKRDYIKGVSRIRRKPLQALRFSYGVLGHCHQGGLLLVEGQGREWA